MSEENRDERLVEAMRTVQREERDKHQYAVFGVMAATFLVSMFLFWWTIGVDAGVSALISLVIAGGSVTTVWKP